MKKIIFLSLLSSLLTTFTWGCSGSSGKGAGSGNGDTDTDADADADSDTDADGDTDTDGDNGSSGNLGCDKMDILFVIDDSDSMECEQQLLAEAFPGFIDVLENYSNENSEQISYRVAVTSTGRTVTYTMQTSPSGSGAAPVTVQGMDGKLAKTDSLSNPWIDGPGEKAKIVSDFSELATLGSDGPGYEMPLECMRLALQKDTSGKENEGFLRKGALSIIVVITDEDDCSREDDNFVLDNLSRDRCMVDPETHNLVNLADYKNYLDAKLGGPSRYVFVAIAGEHDCSDGETYPVKCGEDDPFAGAREALRIKHFVTNFINSTKPQNGLFTDICTSDMPSALSQALEKMKAACNVLIM